MGLSPSAVVVPVPAAEPLVSAWRQRFDASAAQGMPAHITALYPFLPEERLTGEVVAELRGLCAAVPALDLTFARFARFPDVLYLDPAPADRLRQLTLAIARRWPEAPPYGGAYDEVVPHLTVAQGATAACVAAIEADVLPRLPLRTRLVEAWLYVFAGARWRARERLAFAG